MIFSKKVAPLFFQKLFLNKKCFHFSSKTLRQKKSATAFYSNVNKTVWVYTSEWEEYTQEET